MARVKHCPVTGRNILDCDCGACDELDGGEPQDGSDEDNAA